MESYRTISGKSEASFTEKKSIFIANISFVDTEEAAQSFLGAVRKEHRTANHNVYAYRLQEGERTRYSDDGEPAKTAGLPVLEVLHHAELVNVIAVVTRYFGGTLLGTGGLVRAYTAAAQAGLAAAQLVTVQPVRELTLVLDYALYERARRLLEAAGALRIDTAFGAGVTLSATLLCGRETALLASLTELCCGVPNAALSEVYYAPF